MVTHYDYLLPDPGWFLYAGVKDFIVCLTVVTPTSQNSSIVTMYMLFVINCLLTLQKYPNCSCGINPTNSKEKGNDCDSMTKSASQLYLI